MRQQGEWAVIGGEYVDLTEIVAIARARAPKGFGAGARILLRGGGSVEVPVSVQTVATLLNSRLDPDYMEEFATEREIMEAKGLA